MLSEKVSLMLAYILDLLFSIPGLINQYEISANHLSQLGIALLGVTAIYLSQSDSPTKTKWACIFGLLGQPFWFYSSFATGNWGIFALCFLYTWAWYKGFDKNWVKPWRESRESDTDEKTTSDPNWKPNHW